MAFSRECFAAVMCLSKTLSIWGSDENHAIIALVKILVI
jgi:hypothetical protein